MIDAVAADLRAGSAETDSLAAGAGVSWEYETFTTSDDPAISRFMQLWEDRRRPDQSIPSRQAFEIEDLMEWLGHILILDVIDGGADFHYRLVGTEIATALGRDYSGRRMSECTFGVSAADVIGEFGEVVAARRPLVRRGHITWAPDKSWRTFRSVHAPLATDGETVDKTMGVLLIGDL
ncbi:PAS domain-containing protein [Nisaea acidiphila]|uniref:PAS domain-containing protein n=1 Tax=Nisaea acidiphila TaxID=1862145 RepID=A0A9J7ANE0_9PROT|nr:PAS domain-containing protein [Nisaea acidiphila]UUX48105.1 PAS domain-containing protein [Nisaea acidiphila]